MADEDDDDGGGRITLLLELARAMFTLFEAVDAAAAWLALVSALSGLCDEYFVLALTDCAFAAADSPPIVMAELIVIER